MRYQAMFNGIDVDVIHVITEIPIIANRMFPETPLPKLKFAAVVPCRNDIAGA
jgi:hypothetical protein